MSWWSYCTPCRPKLTWVPQPDLPVGIPNFRRVLHKPFDLWRYGSVVLEMPLYVQPEDTGQRCFTVGPSRPVGLDRRPLWLGQIIQGMGEAAQWPTIAFTTEEERAKLHVLQLAALPTGVDRDSRKSGLTCWLCSFTRRLYSLKSGLTSRLFSFTRRLHLGPKTLMGYTTAAGTCGLVAYTCGAAGTMVDNVHLLLLL